MTYEIKKSWNDTVKEFGKVYHRFNGEPLCDGDTLEEILKKHKKWLEEEGGQRADLREADLAGAKLALADLAGANLTKADLTGADLTLANLYGAKLFGADLTGAKLTAANLDGVVGWETTIVRGGDDD